MRPVEKRVERVTRILISRALRREFALRLTEVVSLGAAARAAVVHVPTLQIDLGNCTAKSCGVFAVEALDDLGDYSHELGLLGRTRRGCLLSVQPARAQHRVRARQKGWDRSCWLLRIVKPAALR